MQVPFIPAYTGM